LNEDDSTSQNRKNRNKQQIIGLQNQSDKALNRA